MSFGSLWDTYVAKPAATLSSYAAPNLLLAAALPGVTREDYAGGLTNLLGGDVGDRNSDGTYNPTWGDAGRQTLDYFTPDYVYEAPLETGQRGTQHGDFFPEGFVPDAWEDPLKQTGWLLAAVAAVVGLVALGR